ncbi:hypothetical protein [Elizabethkingia ursingii]|uniref:hypothetical protein n=1 Tax=Elizabethkingia ursingii TaxID=1756150 RepID=UPI000751566E|nr:hypothetical protein [Elizabethkingia ursingii]KUY28028.1 hypothetical protein ATB96_19525 [Elizabethkingia ursingii]
MQKFIDKIFVPIILPIILVPVTLYMTEYLDLKLINNFFSESTNKFIKFFSKEFYLWQIIISGLLIFSFIKIFPYIFKPKSKQEIKMINAISKSPHYHRAILGGQYTFNCKFKLSVKNEEYVFDSFIPYCETCPNGPVRMSSFAYGSYRCNCGSHLEYNYIKDIQSRIITEVERLE